MSDSLEAFEALVRGLGDRAPDVTEYRALSAMMLDHPMVPRLQALDPHSEVYREAALALYRDLRGSERAYVAEEDERSGALLPDNVMTGVSPWIFRDAGMIAEFLFSWGQIMRALALPPNSEASILEYGSGSGQLLLMLARIGLRVAAVDIDLASLESVRAQAALMRVEVRTEQAGFGEGFEGERFDRIIFFEAFHHAIGFDALLGRLRQRLNEGGRLILCGEPVVGTPLPSIPYPWGPRLDGLSVFCIRRYGWMELGFTESFLVEAMQRRGWLVEVRPMAECGRANSYVCEPYLGRDLEPGRLGSLGAHDHGWEGGEETHRWTRGGERATFPLPDREGPTRVLVRCSNVLPRSLTLTLFDGDERVGEVGVPAGARDLALVVEPCHGRSLGLYTEGARPADLWPETTDTRQLGVAVHAIRIDLSDQVGPATLALAGAAQASEGLAQTW